MELKAPLRMVYIFDDGSESDLALGHVDVSGMIAVERIADGQEERVQTVVEELNASDRVYVRGGSKAPDAAPHTLVKQAIFRGMPGFHDALRETARRFYGIDLRFDQAVLEGGLGVSAPAVAGDTAAEDDGLGLPPPAVSADPSDLE